MFTKFLFIDTFIAYVDAVDTSTEYVEIIDIFRHDRRHSDSSQLVVVQQDRVFDRVVSENATELMPVVSVNRIEGRISMPKPPTIDWNPGENSASRFIVRKRFRASFITPGRPTRFRG